MKLNKPAQNFQARSTQPIGRTGLLCLLLLACLRPAVAQEVQGCGSLTNPFGPFDYRQDKYIPETTYRSHRILLKTVEDFHFTPEIESLRQGKTGGSAGGDLDYLLRVFPNHHRGLVAMANLGEKEKTTQAHGARYSVDCWFRRAVTWRPDDNIVRMIYAKYLSKSNRDNEAAQQLAVAAQQAGDNAFTQHNIGMVYFDMKNYEKALAHARIAYELGLGVPTLREQLKSVGKWSDPAEAASAPVAESAVKPP